MSNPNTTITPDEQRRLEEIAMKKAELRSKIANLERKLTNTQAKRISLIHEKEILEQCISDWASQKYLYESNEIVYEIVITNVFEGKGADQIKTDVEQCIIEMDGNNSQVNELKDDVAAQISRLNDYETCLRGDIAGTQAMLNQLGGI